MAGAFGQVRGNGLTFGTPCPAAQPGVAFRKGSTSLDNDSRCILDGGSNGDRQACAWFRGKVAMWDNLSGLTLSTAYPEGNDRLSTETQTHAASLQGSFKARMRTEFASGVNANLGTYFGPARGASHGDVDVENLARDTRQVQPALDSPDWPTCSRVMCLRDGGEPGIEGQACTSTGNPDRARSYTDRARADELAEGEVPELARAINLGHRNTTKTRNRLSKSADSGRPLALAIGRVACAPPRAEGQLPEPALCTRDTIE
ncbi:family 16 glycosylhydrolase [Rubellimicrobium rubrum]|nr:family 16 glycosylhydrolase [Rubellimicrobium rubrum]